MKFVKINEHRWQDIKDPGVDLTPFIARSVVDEGEVEVGLPSIEYEWIAGVSLASEIGDVGARPVKPLLWAELPSDSEVALL